jgi:hypothetical protein
MDDKLKKYKTAFIKQRNNARRRGVEWQLTFDEWVAWWGDDIELRGTGRDNLQMQRYGDKGPYALGNIKKGVPAQNSATVSKCAANRRAEKARREHQAYLDALMWAKSKDNHEPDHYEDIAYEMKSNGLTSVSSFLIDRKGKIG